MSEDSEDSEDDHRRYAREKKNRGYEKKFGRVKPAVDIFTIFTIFTTQHLKKEKIMNWKELAKNGKIEDAIVEYVRDLDYVSFVELQDNFENYMKTRGDRTIEVEKNVIMWMGMSHELAEMIVNLEKAKRIYFHPGNAMSYMIDGSIPDMPVCQQHREYKTPHWVPTTLRTVPR